MSAGLRVVSRSSELGILVQAPARKLAKIQNAGEKQPVSCSLSGVEGRGNKPGGVFPSAPLRERKIAHGVK